MGHFLMVGLLLQKMLEQEWPSKIVFVGTDIAARDKYLFAFFGSNPIFQIKIGTRQVEWCQIQKEVQQYSGNYGHRERQIWHACGIQIFQDDAIYLCEGIGRAIKRFFFILVVLPKTIIRHTSQCSNCRSRRHQNKSEQKWASSKVFPHSVDLQLLWIHRWNEAIPRNCDIPNTLRNCWPWCAEWHFCQVIVISHLI